MSKLINYLVSLDFDLTCAMVITMIRLKESLVKIKISQHFRCPTCFLTNF